MARTVDRYAVLVDRYHLMWQKNKVQKYSKCRVQMSSTFAKNGLPLLADPPEPAGDMDNCHAQACLGLYPLPTIPSDVMV